MVGLFDHPNLDIGGIEEGGKQIVGEGRVADDALFDDEFFHDGQPDALKYPPFDLSDDCLRVEGLSDVLSSVHLHHSHQPQLDVHIDHRPVSRDGESGVNISLTEFIRRFGRWVAEPHRVLHRSVGTDLAKIGNESTGDKHPFTVEFVAPVGLEDLAQQPDRGGMNRTTCHLGLA